jgi:3-isopropylmalate dehydratase small subunit
MTIIEKILAHHSTYDVVRPGEIVNISIDLKTLRDLGGPTIVKNLIENKLPIYNPENTCFTFDYQSSITDPAQGENQQLMRSYARDNGIKLFDIHSGIGSHIMIDQGIAVPGIIMTSGDVHANILGAIGAFGCGLNDKDLNTAFTKGKIWYRVPKSIKINLTGSLPDKVTAKDLALNLMSIFGTNKLLGYAVELTGKIIDSLSLDSRITLASMAYEMGSSTFLMVPNQEVMDYCQYKSKRAFTVFTPDEDAEYEDSFTVDVSKFQRMVSIPGSAELSPIEKVLKKGIDSAFIGTCTNGRIEDLRMAAGILKGRKIAPGVILKIVPSTDEIWTLALQEGLIDIFKEAGAMVTNAGCGGCASGQFVQNSFGEVTISTGNKNYAGRTGKTDVYLASPVIVAASSIAGFITTPEHIPDEHLQLFSFPNEKASANSSNEASEIKNQDTFEGKAWYIPYDNIDTDMIYNSRYTEFTDLSELGNYTFSHFEGYENFSAQVNPGDILIVGKDFGLGNSSQHAVDCFKSLGIQAIIGKSFAVLYERNAINAGLPIIVCSKIDKLQIHTGDTIQINLQTGEIINLENQKSVAGEKFSGIHLKTPQEKVV